MRAGQLDIEGVEKWDGQGIKPLTAFRPEHRERIEREAEQERPPPKWLTLSDGMVQIPSRGWAEWHRWRGKDPWKARSGHRVVDRLRQAVIDRDGNVCGLCGLDVDPSDIHVDHIEPWSLGGLDTLANLQVAHSRCNIKKGNRV